MSSAIVIISAEGLNFRNNYQTLAHESKYSHQCTHCLKYYFETLLSARFFKKKAKGILQSPPSVRLSVMLSPPKTLNEI